MATSALQTAGGQQQPKTIKGWLQSDGFRTEIAKVLPKHCDPDRMLRIAITTLTGTPKLAECDQASFMRCMLDLAQWGLEPNGRDAHLIPFRNSKRGCIECQLILDYKGLVKLLFRSGIVRSIHADVVHEGDLFDYSMGDVLRHTPWFVRMPQDRPEKEGKVFAVYCRVVMTDGAVKCELMSADEVASIRKRSKAADSGPWVTDWSEMAKKTCFKRATKWLPLNADVADAIDRDFDAPDFQRERSTVVAQMPTLDALAAPVQPSEPDQAAEPQQPESEAYATYAALIEDATDEQAVADIVQSVAQDNDVAESEYAALLAAADAKCQTLKGA